MELKVEHKPFPEHKYNKVLFSKVTLYWRKYFKEKHK
jgi:hypothetical protein